MDVTLNYLRACGSDDQRTGSIPGASTGHKHPSDADASEGCLFFSAKGLRPCKRDGCQVQPARQLSLKKSQPILMTEFREFNQSRCLEPHAIPYLLRSL